MPYREVQRFWLNRTLLFIGVGLVAVAVALALSPADILKGTPDGWTYAALGVPLLLSLVSLKTEVTADGVVYVGFHPVRRGRRAIAVRQIERAEAVRYSPIGEFGGYGWRVGAGGSRAYNVAGKRGVRLSLSNGKTVMVGSQRPDELAAAIEAVRQPSPLDANHSIGADMRRQARPRCGVVPAFRRARSLANL